MESAKGSLKLTVRKLHPRWNTRVRGDEDAEEAMRIGRTASLGKKKPALCPINRAICIVLAWCISLPPIPKE